MTTEHTAKALDILIDLFDSTMGDPKTQHLPGRELKRLAMRAVLERLKRIEHLEAPTQELLPAPARVPLSVVDAIKQGLQADEATRHHCRGTTNWAAAMTRFYELAHSITQEKQG